MSKINVKMEDSSSEDEVELPPQKPKIKNKFKKGQQAECIKCKQQKKIASKDMCSVCYRSSLEPNSFCITCRKAARVGKEGFCISCRSARNKKIRKADVNAHKECGECKQIKFIVGHGLCKLCYRRSQPKTKKQCQDCGQTKILMSKGVCGNCQRNKRAKTDIRMCKNCGYMRSHYADKMCRPCYSKTHRNDLSKYRECAKCGLTDFILAHGMCSLCYNQSRKEDTSKHKECAKCKQTKPIYGHRMCIACFRQNRAQQLKTDTSKHKKCATCNKLKPILCREVCRPCYMKIFANPKRSAKQTIKKPKAEPESTDNEFNELSVSPISLEDFKLEALSEEDDQQQRSVSPVSMSEFKMEQLSDTDEFDPDQPGPSWKY